MNKKIIIVAVAILGLIGLCLIFSLSGGGGQADKYDLCVRRCLDDAREANINRDDITDEDYQTIMAEHRAYICPGKCEDLK